MTPHLYLIIPSHNRANLLNRCLECIAVQTYKNFSVIVIDDGSTDGTKELLRDQFPWVTVLAGDGNLWWTGGVQLGVQHVLINCRGLHNRDAHAIVLINDDLEFNNDFLENLLKAQKTHPHSLIGSVVLDIDNRSLITHGGCQIHWYNAKLRHLNRGSRIEEFLINHAISVSVVSGRGVLIPLKVFDKVGNFNKKRFPQHGDMEFGVRAERSGFKLIAAYRAKVYCHFNLDNDVNQKTTRGIKGAIFLLTDQRSYLNIRERWWFAICSRKNIVQLICFVICDFLRTMKSVIEKTCFR